MAIATVPKITKMRKRLEKMNAEVDGFLQQAFEREKSYIISLQTKNQLWKGQRADDKEIVPEYGALTISIKKKKGQPTNRVTLKDTGDFYKAMDVDFTDKDFQIINFDKKFSKLEKKYTDEILGLNTENRALLKERVRQKLVKFFIKKLLM